MGRRVPTPSRPDQIRFEDGDWYETIGSSVCHICGCRYDEHVPVPGYWWLTRICDGDMVKL